jgi:isoamylase
VTVGEDPAGDGAAASALDPPAHVAPMAGVGPGASDPLGANLVDGGLNVSVCSPHASRVELLLFDDPDDGTPSQVVPLTARTDAYWHALVPGLRHGQVYALRADGPWAPERGLRFDATRALLDPYGRAVAIPSAYDRESSGRRDPAAAMKSVVVDPDRYDWQGDRPLRRPFRDTIVYEAHLRGFTAHPSSGLAAALRGTYAGFIERIPYLVDLGITAVELLPIFQFDPLAAPAGRTNYWGYQPVSFFAPHLQYSSRGDPLGAVDEFRDLVRALHRAGLEVILDVVYNHTAEGGPDGPTFCFRGLANELYYIPGADPSRYADYTGTGNTLAADRPVVRRMILDSLRYWVREMHVDGFRFDLAAVLSRGLDGRPLTDPATLLDIDTDPALAGTKLIAEAWDAGGLYEVGRFAGDRWVEWNGRFRDDVRSFLKSDPGHAGAVAQRLLASPDIYGPRGREPQESINFVTCHDGFTLNDLVSYDRKHNEANGEDGRDGSDDNASWNCGVEGPTDDPEVERLRARQVRNFLALDLLAAGVPMLLMGDEVRRTQGGNNNAYCQDDEISWFDWSGRERHADLLRFTRLLTAGRRRLQLLLDAPPDLSLAELLRESDIELSGIRLGQPDLGDASRSIAITVRGRHAAIHLIVNAYWEPLDFEVPAADGGLLPWRRFIDTSLPSPQDIVEAADAPEVGASYRVAPRSVVLLATARDGGTSGDATDDGDTSRGRPTSAVPPADQPQGAAP